MTVKRKLLVGVLAVLALLAYAASRTLFPPELPFDSNEWLAHPAKGFAAYTLRYRMRNGAMEAAKRCKNSSEVQQLLGWEGEAEGVKGSKPTDYSHALLYVLGDRREPLRYWIPSGTVTMRISFDHRDRVIGTEIYAEDQRFSIHRY